MWGSLTYPGAPQMQIKGKIKHSLARVPSWPKDLAGTDCYGVDGVGAKGSGRGELG